MADRKKRAKTLLGAGVLAALTATTPPLYAAVPSVALGEVSTRVVRADVDLGEVLRTAVLEQLETLESPKGSKGPVILSAALVRLETEGGRVTCVVSATLRTARGGTMIAIVEGRSGLETEAPLTLRSMRQAVEAAAHAAMARVPEALR
jgi:hypothetical protein